MPYKVYKKGSGYKACKKNGKKCFSKKPMSKEKAQDQMKALYASESLVIEEVQEDNLVYKTLFKYPKKNEFHVHFNLESGKDVLFNIIYDAGDPDRLGMEDVDYIETQVTDPSIPSIEFFEDPQSEEAKTILSRYGLTEDQIENAGQEGYEKIEAHQVKEENMEESLEFEALHSLIMSSEKKKDS